jgi:GNAT superfamily N-acetyltransferase
MFSVIFEDTELDKSLHIRTAQRSDLAAMKAVVEANELFPGDMLDDMIEPFLAGADGAFWLVFDETVVSGIAYCSPEMMTDGTWNLLLIAVDPRVQGFGVGTALVKAVERRLSQVGARILLVETSGQESFARSRRFYARCGFVEEARIRAFYAVGDDKIVFWKAL